MEICYIRTQYTGIGAFFQPLIMIFDIEQALCVGRSICIVLTYSDDCGGGSRKVRLDPGNFQNLKTSSGNVIERRAAYEHTPINVQKPSGSHRGSLKDKNLACRRVDFGRNCLAWQTLLSLAELFYE